MVTAPTPFLIRTRPGTFHVEIDGQVCTDVVGFSLVQNLHEMAELTVLRAPSGHGVIQGEAIITEGALPSAAIADVAEFLGSIDPARLEGDVMARIDMGSSMFGVVLDVLTEYAAML